MSSAFQGLTGIFTAIQGAQALFGKESENVQRALVKLQGSLALLQGVQAAVATVTEQSAAKTVLAEKAQKAYNLVVGNSTGALKGFKIALAATGIGLAVVAIAALVTNWDKLKGAITGVSKEQEDFNKAKAEGFKNYADEATQVDILITKYKDENTTKEERISILNKLNEISPNYFKTLDAEKVNVDELTESYKKYLKALENKGAIEVLAKQLSDLRVQKLELEASFTEVVKEDDGTLRRIAGTQQNINALQRLDRQMEAIRKQIIAINNEQGILGGDPIDAEEIIPEGTIKDLERKIAKLREQINITDPKSTLFFQLDKQADELELELERIKKTLENVKRVADGDIIKVDSFNPKHIEKAKTEIEKLNDEFLILRESIKEAGSELLVLNDGFIIMGERKDPFKEIREGLEETDKGFTTLRGVIKDSSEDISQSFATIFGSLAALSKEGSKQQLALSIANIIAANAEALANAIKQAINIPYPANIPAVLSSVALVGSMFAQVKSLIGQAKAAQSENTSVAPTVSQFAEGEVDIHRKGEKKGKDSIPALIMPGESVLTAEKTKQYKPLISAIHEGNIEDLIRVNYVEPALALKALGHVSNDSKQVDYSDKLYRQYVAATEQISLHKKEIGLLASINEKLNNGIPDRYR